MKRAMSSRPTREEILKGIGYEPLTFPASLHVPEALRAKEDRAMQDYIVAWTLGLWDSSMRTKTFRIRARSWSRASMKESTREMLMAALPIAATRDLKVVYATVGRIGSGKPVVMAFSGMPVLTVEEEK